MTNREILDNKLSSIWKDNGAFFAFSDEQFDEQSTEGVQYVNRGAGLIVPKDNIKKVDVEMKKATDEFHQAEVATVGKKKLIWRELANYECQISYDPTEAIYALEGFGITEEEIKAEWPAYLQHCVDNDCF